MDINNNSAQKIGLDYILERGVADYSDGDIVIFEHLGGKSVDGSVKRRSLSRLITGFVATYPIRSSTSRLMRMLRSAAAYDSPNILDSKSGEII